MSAFVKRYETLTLGQCIVCVCYADYDPVPYSECGLPLAVMACCVQSVRVAELVAV